MRPLSSAVTAPPAGYYRDMLNSIYTINEIKNEMEEMDGIGATATLRVAELYDSRVGKPVIHREKEVRDKTVDVRNETDQSADVYIHSDVIDDDAKAWMSD